MGGLAGCTSSLPFVGSGDFEVDQWLTTVSFEDVLDDETVEEQYDDADLEETEELVRMFSYVEPEMIFDNESDIDTYAPLESGSELRGKVGVTASEIDWALQQSANWEYEFDLSYGGSGTTEGSTTVLAGDFDTDDVEDALERWVDDEFDFDDDDDDDDDDDGFESAGSQGDFDLYTVEDYAFGVSDDYVVATDAPALIDAVSLVESTIDTKDDEQNRWTDDDDGELLLSELESGGAAFGILTQPRTVENELEDQYDDPDDASEEEREAIRDRIEDWEYGLVGQARSQDVDGSTTDICEVFVYESEGEADSDALQEHVERNRDIGDDWATLEDYSIDADGRVLILTGEVRTRALF
ncbi:hypothetical protein C493_17661 [Natronolimnohabitans innermongolicus JCM 12255]|uniref:Uncharacterized protein n=2 Tax=Natronolimnohabitans innermongolicus TaxID=253107 RepID=L9WP55_9EURY|nr:hypothetical protein C493_17661 [Natronolimnohabitans innermongolicus JCM 12255]